MSKFLGLAVAAASTVFAAQAFAATSTQTFFTGTSPFTTGPAQNQTFPFTNNLTVASFSPSQGTLNSVTITVNGSVSVLASVTNITSTPRNFSNALASVPVTITVPSAGVTVASQTYNSGAAFAGTVGAFSTVSGTPNVTTVANSFGVSTAAFTTGSPSTVTLQVTGGDLTASGVGVNGATFFGGDAFANLTVTVAFDFTPPAPPAVPEPASLALLGLGLAAVGVIRRRA